jgi:hypothetical protein
LEEDHLFPMLKSSELANGTVRRPQRWMLVPQRSINEDTARIKKTAPKTWAYLQAHAGLLDARASVIYRKRPQFAIFGIGAYSLAPYKVAISGFYKKLQFVALGSFAGKPILLDDTAYFIACQSEAESSYLAGLLNSEVATEFFSAFIFWDAKRPITVDLLRRLDLHALAEAVGSTEIMERLAPRKVEAELFRERDGDALRHAEQLYER